MTFSKVRGSSSATNSFITGCDHFRIEAIRSHEKSEYHIKSEEFTHARSLQVGTSVAEKTIQDLNINVTKKIIILFKNVHALVKKQETLYRLCLDDQT